MPLWIFAAAWVCPSTANFTFQFSIAFVMKFMTLSDVLDIFRHSIIQVCRTTLCYGYIFPPNLNLLEYVLIYIYNRTSLPLISRPHSFCSSGNSPQHTSTHYYFTFWGVFHTSVCWWAFTGIQVTVNLLRSPELFSEFWLISTMVRMGLSPFFLWSPTLPVSFQSFSELFQARHLQLVSPLSSCSKAFF